MEVAEAIQKRTSVREYTSEKVSSEVLEQLLAAAHAAPSSCNLQLTEYIVVQDEAMRERLAQKVTPKFLWAPTFIILIYDTRFTVKRRAALTSLGTSVQNIALTATSLGLGTCPMAGFKNDAFLKEALGIPTQYAVALIMAVGYPAKPEMQKEREQAPLADVVHWGAYEGSKHVLPDSPHLRDWTLEEVIAYRKRMAPVYLYGDWFHLSSFKPPMYTRVLEKLQPHLPDIPDPAILDLVTYDGGFFSTIASALPNAQLTATDYLAHTLRVIQNNYPQARTVLIDTHSGIDMPDASQDVVTFVHKIEFTPKREQLLREAYRVLKPGGTLCITAHTDSFFGRLQRMWKQFKKKYVQSELVNVYENSSYYKIGPVGNVGAHTMDALAEAMHLTKVSGGRERNPHFIWRVYRK